MRACALQACIRDSGPLVELESKMIPAQLLAIYLTISETGHSLKASNNSFQMSWFMWQTTHPGHSLIIFQRILFCFEKRKKLHKQSCCDWYAKNTSFTSWQWWTTTHFFSDYGIGALFRRAVPLNTYSDL
jgi:hypothetical protein